MYKCLYKHFSFGIYLGLEWLDYVRGLYLITYKTAKMYYFTFLAAVYESISYSITKPALRIGFSILAIVIGMQGFLIVVLIYIL